MKTRLMALGGLVAVLGSTAAYGVWAQNNCPAPPAGPRVAAFQDDRDEAHPEIHRAIRSLERAREYLQHADHDFGGHRVEALEATGRAIRQLRVCLRYDRH